jgi:hypothetical protein
MENVSITGVLSPRLTVTAGRGRSSKQIRFMTRKKEDLFKGNWNIPVL